MAIVSFLLTSMLVIVLGMYSFFNFYRSFFTFLLIFLLIPSSNQFVDFISKSGIFYYDFYFLFIFLLYFWLTISKKIKIDRNFFLLLFCFIILNSYLILSIMELGSINKYVLRDFRPFLVLIYSYVFFSIYKSQKKKINFASLMKIVQVTAIAKIITYLIIILSGVKVTEDVYYEDNGLRYSDGGSYLAIVFILYALTEKRLKNYPNKTQLNLTYLLCFTTILISNSRIIMAAMIFSLFLFGRINIFFKISGFSFLVGLFLLFSFLTNYEHVIANLSGEGILFQLYNRYAPAIIVIQDMNLIEYLIGKGLGTTFYISWFDYRGLDTTHFQVDCTYLTFFPKFGLFSLIILAMTFANFTKGTEKKIKMALITFLAIIFLTMSVSYQVSGVFLIIFSNILAFSLNELKKKDNKINIKNANN